MRRAPRRPSSAAGRERPTVSVSGGYTRTNHVDVFRILSPPGLVRVIYPDVPDNYFTRASVRWPIYTAGRTDALQRAAEAEARAAGPDVEVARADLRLEVVRAYWALATALESQRVLDEAVSRADADVRDVRSRFDNGLIPPNEVSSAEAQRSRQQVQQIEARNLRSSAIEDLRRHGNHRRDRNGGAPRNSQPPGVIASAQASPRAERQAASRASSPPTNDAARAEAGRRPDGCRDRRRTTPTRIRASFRDTDPGGHPGKPVSVPTGLWDGGRINAESAEAPAPPLPPARGSRRSDSLIALEIRQRQLDLDSARASLMRPG